MILRSADPGFSVGGAPTIRGGGVSAYDLAKFPSKKLYEIEEILGRLYSLK